MEYLDYYDEEGNYLGCETREEVHKRGLWHNTVHNWLYTEDGKVIFQIRKDSKKLYTTSSGHVNSKESVEEAFRRETKEEIGINIDSKSAKLIGISTWIMDKVKSDGTLNKDRAKAHIFIAPYVIDDMKEFRFDRDEVEGIALVDVIDTLKLFKHEKEQIEALFIMTIDGVNVEQKRLVSCEDFLTLNGETEIDKYGHILESIVKELRK